MSSRNLIVLGGIIVAILVIIGITMLGRQDQTTRQELLPGTTEPAPTSEQVLDGQEPQAVPAPAP